MKFLFLENSTEYHWSITYKAQSKLAVLQCYSYTGWRRQVWCGNSMNLELSLHIQPWSLCSVQLGIIQQIPSSSALSQTWYQLCCVQWLMKCCAINELMNPMSQRHSVEVLYLEEWTFSYRYRPANLLTLKGNNGGHLTRHYKPIENKGAASFKLWNRVKTSY